MNFSNPKMVLKYEKNYDFFYYFFFIILSNLLMPKKRDSTVMRREPKSLFCTECDEELENFCFSKKSKNKKAIKKRHEKCVKSGKFSGEFCSRIFISGDFLLDEIWEKEE